MAGSIRSVKKKEREERNIEREENGKEMSGSLFTALICLGISVLFMLILFGAFGKAGDYVNRYFFLGIFGFASYGAAIALFVAGILKLFKVKVKVSPAMACLYVATLCVVILMCHLATARVHVAMDESRSWGDYIRQCYLGADTAGGVIFSLLTYPLLLSDFMYIFSMVVLGLVTAGLVALIVVCMFNLDKIAARRRAAKLGKISTGEDYISAGRREPFRRETPREPEDGLRTIGTDMYNGTVKGKKLDGNFRGAFFNRPTSVKSIDKLAEEEQEQVDDDIIAPDVSGAVKMYKELDKATAAQLLYGEESREKPAERRREVTRDDAAQLLYGESPEFAEDEPQASEEEQSGHGVDMRLYFNSTRKRNLEENIAKLQSESAESDDEVDRFINKTIAKEQKDDFHLTSSFDDERKKSEEVEDKSDRSDRVMEDFSELFGKKEEKKQDDAPVRPSFVEPTPEPKIEPVIEPKPESRVERREEPKIELERKVEVRPEPKIEIKPLPKVEPSKPVEKKEEKEEENTFNGIPVFVPVKTRKYTPPKLELLEDYAEKVNNNVDFNAMVAELERTLEDFKVPAKVVNIVQGPAFSRFELQMPRSISVKEIPKLEEDIRACLMVDSIRIEAPIRGKNLVGIEVPNKERGKVGLKSVINSTEFIRADKNKGLYFGLGKDIDNNNYVCNICDFPHALVAGSSGSGKSVFLNCLLCSMVYKYSPQDVRFLLIDPKVVEFKPYEGLPHMLLPYAISDEHMAIKALEWLVNEMEYRYNLFSQSKVSNLSEYNAAQAENKLPSIVLIVDEVGDIMTSSVSKEFEQLIKRLAQKARAAGISMILATQRPSVDVITGTIKANLPTRIAFAVTSYIDSKTILDSVGAEKLLRYGDMLYKEGSKPNMVRVQGALILSKEIYAVANYVKEHNEAHFDPAIEKYITTVEEEKTSISDSGELANGSFAEDPYFVQVLKYVIETNNVSISKLQRVFGLGFPRAAKLVDKMEAQGYIEHSIPGKKERAVLITMDQFNALYGDGNGAEG